MTDDERKQHVRRETRDELKRRLRVQLYDFKYTLQHCTNSEGMTDAGRCLGTIAAMRHEGLLTDEEVSEFQAQVRADFAERLPQYLEYFDALCLRRELKQ